MGRRSGPSPHGHRAAPAVPATRVCFRKEGSSSDTFLENPGRVVLAPTGQYQWERALGAGQLWRGAVPPWTEAAGRGRGGRGREQGCRTMLSAF